MAGKRSPPSQSISRLTSPHDQIASSCWRSRRANPNHIPDGTLDEAGSSQYHGSARLRPKRSSLASHQIELLYFVCRATADVDASDVSNFAQTPDRQRRNRILIDTPSQSVRSSFQRAEPEPIRVSVSSLRNMSGERKYHASTCNSARRIAEASAARRSRRCRRNDVCWLLLGWLVARQHR